jgi:hypothetical protein
MHGGYRAWRMPSFTEGRDQDEGYTDKKENEIFLIYMEQLKSHI